ncbi:MAG TPA: M28 family peptidase [Methylomirabilota bacterium]|nr:M28 family peptidase [Methylomirabilota bacterium]
MRLVTGAALRRLGVLLSALAGLLAVAAVVAWMLMLRMPGTSYRGPLPPLTAAEAMLRDELRRDVDVLAGEIGERDLMVPGNLARAVAHLEAAFAAAGYPVRRQTYETRPEAFHDLDVERVFHNLEVERAGTTRAAEVIVVGAHYDTVLGTRGANDNASGTAAVLALARRFARRSPARTIRFVTFANEEIYFQRPEMGSWVYAKALRQRGDRVVTMLSLETIGYYSDQPGTQLYPPPLTRFYPSTGNFIAFVGNYRSRAQVREALAAFRRHARFPSEGAAIPNVLPGVGWSDHWAFWQVGYPGVMVTDTAPYRYRWYHTPQDTPEKIDYERMARVVAGLELMLADLAGIPSP